MTSRCKKVWCALWLAMLANLFVTVSSHAQTTYPLDIGNTMVPSVLPNLVVGDRVQFKIKTTYHVLYMNGQPLFGGVAVFSGQEFYQTFNTEGTFQITDSRTSGTCIITVTQPVNAAPTVSLNIPTNRAAIAVTNSMTNLTLRANAEDEDTNGSVRRVQFYYGVGTNTANLTNLIGTFTNSANTNNTVFNFVWTNARPGRYLLQSRAYDNKEVYANSTRVNLSLYTPFTNTLTSITNISSVKNLVFRFNTDTGLVYVVEASTNLTNWAPILTNTATNSFIQVLDTNVNSLTNRMYRVRLVP